MALRSEVFSVLQARVGSHVSKVNKLDAEVERTGGDVDVFGDDLRQLIDKVPWSSSEQNEQQMLEPFQK